jgi:hypothetical protein
MKLIKYAKCILRGGIAKAQAQAAGAPQQDQECRDHLVCRNLGPDYHSDHRGMLPASFILFSMNITTYQSQG